MKKLIAILFIIFNSSFLILNSTKAHPVPYVIQNIKTEFKEKEVNVHYRISIDPIVSNQIYNIIDTNNDGKTSDEEIDAYSNNIVLKSLGGRLNSKDLALIKVNHKPLNLSEVKGLSEYLEINYSVENPKLLDTNTFLIKYDKIFLSDDPYGDQILISTNLQENQNYSIISSNTSQGAKAEYSVDFKDQTQNIITSNKKSNDGNILQKISTKSKELTSKIYDNKQTGILFAILGLLIAFIAGSLHAFTPGHGKSMMAAFLVGKNKSTSLDVLILASSITVSHTIVIFVLGFILLVLDKSLNINNVIIYFEKISAILLILLAGNLIRTGYRNYKHLNQHKNGEKHHHHHDHSHDFKKKKIHSKYDLFIAGIGGGIVPCIDALSLLILSASLGKIVYGLILILFFSFGLAASIVFIGLMLVLGKNKLKFEKRFQTAATIFAPLVSGIVILFLSLQFIF